MGYEISLLEYGISLPFLAEWQDSTLTVGAPVSNTWNDDPSNSRFFLRSKESCNKKHLRPGFSYWRTDFTYMNIWGGIVQMNKMLRWHTFLSLTLRTPQHTAPLWHALRLHSRGSLETSSVELIIYISMFKRVKFITELKVVSSRRRSRSCACGMKVGCSPWYAKWLALFWIHFFYYASNQFISSLLCSVD